MSVKPTIVRDFDPAKDELSTFCETVYIVSNANAVHGWTFVMEARSILPFHANTESLPGCTALGEMARLPPAHSTSKAPAAISHQFTLRSTYASKRPVAT